MRRIQLLILVYVLMSCRVGFASFQPPIAKQIPNELKALDDVRQDPYFWLRGKQKPEVLQYLNAENTYFKEIMSPHRSFYDRMLRELRGHIQEDESTYPYRDGDYLYFSKSARSQEYPVKYRKPVAGGPLSQF